MENYALFQSYLPVCLTTRSLYKLSPVSFISGVCKGVPLENDCGDVLRFDAAERVASSQETSSTYLPERIIDVVRSFNQEK